ncbi:uncharacterized protein LOC109721542 isoform X1 [Ananas comosus]|uniref:procollagen-proline 3-dioxygenase n=1 Tax=Ananas comosus TaxID=4615 RepID=A0A199UST9_ANACO|nr:uncharacterized protein LOC109721542 isoform X1 [Ananas comosus]XP_020104800.1 uncharacterized protein LOC109721542 isoform X1 [Ananas comosus]XP_020104809.1 uncharacterized protein LOC109721542 isoform X1 [Ananas comosus]OAY67877.1 Prolyl 3-hydroxylase 1 [Ananas comosus]
MAAAAAADAERGGRHILRGFVSRDLCKELEFIHRSCGAVGYRPGVLSTTLLHLAATDCAHLLLPFLPVRDRLRDTVESLFACDFALFVEFTALISWCKGASIGWHSDDNKPYLKQRDFAAVCYLNNHGKDFKGGIFHFQDGEPSAVVPFAGDVVIYTADRRNVHCVDEVIEGERLTLTLWFTRDSAHDEDAKLLSLLSHQPSSNNNFNNPNCFLPSPASNNMYWFSNEKSGFDIRCARVQFLGYSFLTTSDLKDSSSDQSIEPFEQLNNPLTLARGDEVFDMKFINSLHALQVLQFYYWKASELAAARSEAIENSESPQLSFRFRTSTDMEICLPCDRELAENTLGCSCYEEAKVFTDSNDLSLAVVAWENYSCKLRRDLLSLMPHWLPNQSIFFADPSELRMYNG